MSSFVAKNCSKLKLLPQGPYAAVHNLLQRLNIMDFLNKGKDFYHLHRPEYLCLLRNFLEVQRDLKICNISDLAHTGSIFFREACLHILQQRMPNLIIT